MNKINEDLKKILETKKIYENRSLKEYTSFKVGGKAKVLVEIESVSDLINILKYTKEKGIKKYILGAGTNLVFSSDGYDGIIIKIDIKEIEQLENNKIKAGAGLKLMRLCEYTKEKELGDMSKIYGIPGSIGGCIKMNAGAFGKEMKDYISEVIYLDDNLNIQKISNKDIDFSYRNSFFKDKDYVILYGIFKLKKENKEKLEKSMKEIMQKRIDNQPLEYPSAGSVFKRGDGFITSVIIDKLGLKGKSIGDAEVSKKHAGFIINKGNAKSEDILKLTQEIKKEVKEKEGKIIETEIIFIDK